MLLVNDGKSEGVILHRIFNQRMGAHNNVQSAGCEAGKQGPAVFAGGAPSKQGAAHSGRGEILLNIGKVLLGKHFGRSHDARLIAIAHGNQVA